jgi:hypothetical protein
VTDQSLVPHPCSAPHAAALTLCARAELTSPTGGLRLVYSLRGDLSQLAIPGHAPSRRAERLWEHTCFEAFIAPARSENYWEVNLSPSTEWAAYAFERFRQEVRPLTLASAPVISVETQAWELDVTASVELGPLAAAPWPWRLGLTAVVEDRAGGKSYWALRHPKATPDFHDAAGFTLLLEGKIR